MSNAGVSAAIRELLRERPGLIFAEIIEALPGARNQLRQMSSSGLLKTEGPRTRLRYYLLTPKEEQARRERLRNARRPLAREPRRPRYEYTEVVRASAAGLNALGAEGWHVVAGRHEEAVYRREPLGNLSEGWTVLLERQVAGT